MPRKQRFLLLILVMICITTHESAHASLWASLKAASTLKSVLIKAPAANQSKTLLRPHYSVQLRKNMNAANKVCAVAWQAHHIIPVALETHHALRKCGFEINAAANGLCMPGAKANAQGRINQHHGYHARYNAAVEKALDGIPRRLSKVQTCQRIEQIQTCFLKGLKSGKPLYGQDVTKAWSKCQR